MRGGFLFICLCFGRRGREGMGWGGEEPISFMVGRLFTCLETEGEGGGGSGRWRKKENERKREGRG